jgi:hypothetical protein
VWENISLVLKLELKFEKVLWLLAGSEKIYYLISDRRLPIDSALKKKLLIKNKVQVIEVPNFQAQLIVCLDKQVHPTQSKPLMLNDNDIFICLDNAITDERK